MYNEVLYNSPNVANKIKECAKSKGIPLKSLLNNCNLGSNTFSHMLHGKSIAFDSLARIADQLDCSVDYLLGRGQGAVTDDELQLLIYYRNLNDIGRKTALDTITGLANIDIYKNIIEESEIKKIAARGGGIEERPLSDGERVALEKRTLAGDI